ncbi:MAG: hypothetical protein WBL35_09560 [Ornithinibacter sp.]
MSNTEDQGQEPEHVSDPTAPAGDAPLTPPYAAPPAGDAAAPSPYPTEAQQPPAYGQPQPYGQDPYAQQPPAYGQPQPHGQDPYAQQPPVYGQPQPYGQAPYSPAPGGYSVPQRNGSALTLTILSGISILCCGGLLTIPALIFGIIGLTKQATDPAESARMTRFGWIAFAIGVVVSVVIGVIFVAVLIGSGEWSTSATYGGY